MISRCVRDRLLNSNIDNMINSAGKVKIPFLSENKGVAQCDLHGNQLLEFCHLLAVRLWIDAAHLYPWATSMCSNQVAIGGRHTSKGDTLISFTAEDEIGDVITCIG